jgi:hypothetical protein
MLQEKLKVAGDLWNIGLKVQIVFEPIQNIQKK